MAELCKNCGEPLPNAVGVGVYCNNCGEPVFPRCEHNWVWSRFYTYSVCTHCGEKRYPSPQLDNPHKPESRGA